MPFIQRTPSERRRIISDLLMLDARRSQRRAGRISPSRRTCWPTLTWAPAWKMINKLFTKPLECYKKKRSLCCCLSKHLALKSHILSASWPSFIQCVDTQRVEEKIGKPNWWTDAVKLVTTLNNARCSSPISALWAWRPAAHHVGSRWWGCSSPMWAATKLMQRRTGVEKHK